MHLDCNIDFIWLKLQDFKVWKYCRKKEWAADIFLVHKIWSVPATCVDMQTDIIGAILEKMGKTT